MNVTIVQIDDSSDRTLTGTHQWDRDNGGIIIPPHGNAFPGSPSADELFWRDDEDKLYKRNSANTAWEEISPASHASTHEGGGGDAITHDNLSGAGSNTHTQIDTHLAATTNPHGVTATQVGKDTAQWNANQLRGTTLSSASPSDGDFLEFSSSANEYQPTDKKDNIRQFWDFIGNNIDTDVWSTAVSGSGSTITIATDQHYGEVVMEGNVVSGYSAFTLKNWSYRSINVSDNFEVSWRVKAVDNYSQVTIGLVESANNQILMYKSGSDNWKVHTYSGGTGTTTDTGVAQDGNYHIFKIIATSSSVEFYIDGTLKATHTTNIPTVDLTIETKLDMLTTDQTYFYCDWIEFKCDR